MCNQGFWLILYKSYISTNMPIIKYKNVDITIDSKVILEDVSFTLETGEFAYIIGAVGSGKSTLLNLMAGIEKLTSGQIIIKGKNIQGA